MTTRHPRLEIEYCTQCRWLLRAGWTAQELLTTVSNRDFDAYKASKDAQAQARSR